MIQIVMKANPLWALVVRGLRALHLRSGRLYQRQVLRAEFHRIGRQIVAERQARHTGGKPTPRKPAA